MKQIMGVIGHPIKHTLSPLMHEAAYNALELNMAYLAFEVKPEDLDKAIHGIRALGLRGINVTIPHKVEVIPFLDEIDDLAKEIGAVNTIVNDNGRLMGYNTDGEGYLKSLLQCLTNDLKGMHVLIIGAGGASKAVALTLAKHGVKAMAICNRTIEKAEDLAKNCGKYVPSLSISLEEAEEQINDFDIIINTTSIGMINENELPISLKKLNKKKDIYFSDLIYTPFQTKLLLEGEKAGAKTLNGLDMFIYQGALAFERWTGHEAPINVMREAVTKHLRGGK
ncbi:shikimate dehydrogenase [Evansella vedderi]|uniref:Shikimate dehydrogenase (NADP(+)) n=1 Tax=Evansella vedderi TaxID=38282 RepID=A0ABT9ZUB6_9BACI|nr:shikimate dehydrogenase [Evansella vedderi]MDQ0254322.1 shikimate dehydrogenase [Evansella vedderi]